MVDKPKYRPQSIDDEGIESWIDAKTDAGFATFKVWYDDYKNAIVSRAAFARKMGVDERTLKDWIARYERPNNG